MIEAAAHVPAGIAVLQSSDENLIDRCSGNNAELTDPGYRACQPPIGDPSPHATLNDGRQMVHAAYFRMAGLSEWNPFVILR